MAEDIYAVESSVPELLSMKPPEHLLTGSLGMEALFRVSARLAGNLDVKSLAVETLEAAIQLVGADGGAVELLDESRQDLVVTASRGLGAPGAIGTRYILGEGALGWVVTNRQPVFLNSAEQKRFPRIYAQSAHVNSVICTPLFAPSDDIHSPHVLGVLCVHKNSDHPVFTREQFSFLSGLSLFAGAAFNNARIFRKLTTRATQYQNMIEISRAITSSLNVDVVLHTITQRAVELLDCQAGSLLLRDQETEEMVFKVALGSAGEKLIGTRLPHGAGIVGAVMRDGKALIVNDAKADPRHYQGVDQNTALTTQSLLCVPLISGAQIYGVIELMNHLDGTPFGDEDRDTLYAFALQAAIALENARLYSDLKGAFAEIVRVMTNALEARDSYTAGHTDRVTQLALKTAHELGWSPAQMEILEIGALTHDIGKIGVPDAILHKPNGLTEDEYEQMKSHPVAGANMLMGIKTLQPLLPYILYHQERYDGNGYPFGLKGEEIPIEARLIAVVDAFDAMTSTRPYRTAMAEELAIAEIVKHRGIQFDPNVVDALLRVLNDSAKRQS